MFGRRIGADDDQARARFLGPDTREHFRDKPVERVLIGDVAKAAEKQDREGLAAGVAEFVVRCIDTGAKTSVDSAMKLGQEGFEIARIVVAANLNAIRAGKHLQLETECTKIFPARRDSGKDTVGERNAARDGLEVDVMLEQNAGNVTEAAEILSH